MARNASGTHSLPAGNPVVTGTAISSTVHNATNTDLSTELTDSLSRSGKGGMLAPLRGVDGSVSAPAVSFTSETGTGFYRAGANDVRLAVAGVDRFQQTATTATFTGGTNGVGVTAVGTGSGAGVHGTGGVTGPGVLATAGSTGRGALHIQSQSDPVALSVAGDFAHDAAGIYFSWGSKTYALTPLAGTITAGTDWTLNLSECRQVGGRININVIATAGATSAWTSIGTLPAGYRPSADLYVTGYAEDTGTAAHVSIFKIATTGVISQHGFDQGGAIDVGNTTWAISATDKVYVTASFLRAGG